jgi:hypothetical protein
MTDPEKTIPPAEKAAAAYKEAEGWFDDVAEVLLKSPLTLAAFVIWTIAALAFGFWAGLSP